MRADRLLSILLLLQIQRRMTARQLAQRLEVSERTIHRDMEALSAAGVPVYAERGSRGGWLLPDEYRANLPGLSDSEMQTLLMGKPAQLLADLGLQQVAERAADKVLGALSPTSRRDVEDARQRLHVDVTGWNRAEEQVPYLQSLQEAVWQECRARIIYRRSDGSTVERLVDPLGLVAKGSIWYLVAAVEGELRTYRIARIVAATLLEQRCQRPADFDLASYWQQATAEFKASLPSYSALVRVEQEVFPLLRHAGRFARVGESRPADDTGCITVEILFQTEQDACGFVLSFGPQIEVLEPAALREKVIDTAQRTIDRYRVRGA